MLDIRRIRSDYDTVKANLQRRNDPRLIQELEKVTHADKHWRHILEEVERLRGIRNLLGPALGSLQKIDLQLYDWLDEEFSGELHSPPEFSIRDIGRVRRLLHDLCSTLIPVVEFLESADEHPEVPFAAMELESFAQTRQNAQNILSQLKAKEEAAIEPVESVEELLSDSWGEFSKAWARVAELRREEEILRRFAGRLKTQIEEAEVELEETKSQRDRGLMRLPNLLHESVPVGEDDTDNEVVRTWGDADVPGHELLPHGELLEAQGLADFERSAKVSGAGFAYLKGEMVLLDRALQQMALDHLIDQGYTPISTPLMMRRAPYEGVTDLGDFEDVMYKVEDHDAYLIATSEHPLGAMYMDEIIDEDDLPLKLAGISQCFRREIGAHGIDTRGLFRMHQFNKVEQFVFCDAGDSWELHEELLANAEHLFQQLELPYRVVNVCTGDIGTVAAKKYDIEAWSPRAETYREVVSCSNCTGYQARRLNIRGGKHGGDKETLHTLNATAIATSRAMVMILENHQNEDGTVTVPEALRPYMNGVEVLGEPLGAEDGEDRDGQDET